MDFLKSMIGFDPSEVKQQLDGHIGLLNGKADDFMSRLFGALDELVSLDRQILERLEAIEHNTKPAVYVPGEFGTGPRDALQEVPKDLADVDRIMRTLHDSELKLGQPGAVPAASTTWPYPMTETPLGHHDNDTGYTVDSRSGSGSDELRALGLAG